MSKPVNAPQGWRVPEEDRMKIARFAMDLENNEEVMGEQAAMHVTCEQHGISEEEGWDWLSCLPDDGHPDAQWWKILEDDPEASHDRRA